MTKKTNYNLRRYMTPTLPKLTWKPGSAFVSWRERAACYEENMTDPQDRELARNLAWLEEEGDSVHRVREICATTCTVQGNCLLDALLPQEGDVEVEGWRGNHFFVGGGLGARSRRIISETYKMRTSRRSRKARTF